MDSSGMFGNPSSGTWCGSLDSELLQRLLCAALVVLAIPSVLFWIRKCLSPDSVKVKCPVVRRGTSSTPPVFPNGWIPVLLSNELAHEEVKTLDVLGLDLVAFRTSDGVAHVFDAYCPHLGAHLGVMGRVVGDCIECPFHGWRFNASDGHCTHVPYASKVPDFVKAKTWPTRELFGLLFLWYHADGEGPTWQIEDEPEITRGLWKQRAHFENIVHCHIQDIAENGADMGHFNHIHKASCLVTEEEFTKTGGDSWWGRLVTHSWEATWMPDSHIAAMNVDASISVMGRKLQFLQHRVFVRQIGPALVIVRMYSKHGNSIIVQSLTPVGPFRVRMVHRFFPEPKLPWVAGWLSVLGFRHMVERDIAVWNRKTYLKQPSLVKEDRCIVAFRKWFSQFYSDNSPTWQSVRDRSLQW